MENVEFGQIVTEYAGLISQGNAVAIGFLAMFVLCVYVVKLSFEKIDRLVHKFIIVAEKAVAIQKASERTNKELAKAVRDIANRIVDND